MLLAIIILMIGAGFYVHRLLFVKRFGVVVDGKLYRSRQPEGLQYSILFHNRDIMQVIDLRSEIEDPEIFAEEKRICQEEGINFISLPIITPVPSQNQVEEFIRLVDESPGPVLVHCAQGRNRAGLMSAAYRVARQGTSVDEAFQEELTAYNANPEEQKRQEVLNLLKAIQIDSKNRPNPTDANTCKLPFAIDLNNAAGDIANIDLISLFPDLRFLQCSLVIFLRWKIKCKK